VTLLGLWAKRWAAANEELVEKIGLVDEDGRSKRVPLPRGGQRP